MLLLDGILGIIAGGEGECGLRRLRRLRLRQLRRLKFSLFLHLEAQVCLGLPQACLRFRNRPIIFL